MLKKIFFLLLFTLFFAKEVQAKLVIDRLGREVLLPDKIEKIISFGSVPLINAFLLSMDQGDKLISALPPWASTPRWKYQNIFIKDLDKRLHLQGRGMHFDQEMLIKAKPDVVFTLTFSKDLPYILEPKGIKVVVLKWDSLADVRPTMELLGEIFDKKERAKKYIKYFENTLKRVENIVKKAKKKPRVLYTRYHNMTQPVLIAEWWIKAAGGISVTDNNRSYSRLVYSMEQLLAYNPDIIILAKKKDKELIKAEKRIKGLEAVKNNKIYIAPSVLHIWAQPTIEQPLTLLWALSIFHPKLYTQEELVKDVRYFYKSFFSKELSDEEIEYILAAKNVKN